LRFEVLPTSANPKVEAWRLFFKGDLDSLHVYPASVEDEG
jgi:hypothetical protein